MTNKEKILPVEISHEMKKCYIDYAMSVIVGRALPDVRDGLKPVHRRILYSMHELGLTPDKGYRKCARIVGDVLGKYHPHGDTAVYDALVRLAQDFSVRYTLVNGHGNFGSVDGDSAAAMRYTEAKMNKITLEMLRDINKDTVDFIPNFDGEEQEPSVIPARFPNLLVNGSAGIAVGMATNIPPHNLSEVINGISMLIDNPEITIAELMTEIKGPDFPTAGIILGRSGIKDAYETGRGKVIIRAKTDIEEEKGRYRIIVSEIPYQVNKAKLIESIADLVKDKKIEGISDIRDESDREGMRIVIELKKDTNPNVILNQLFKHTKMQDTFGIIMLALVNNKPEVLNLKQILVHYLEFQKEVIRRRTKFDLNKALARAHILEGLRIALDHIDEIINLIRSSKNGEEAKNGLINSFDLSEKQAQAILDMRLQRLTGLEREKIENEYKELESTITYLKDVLAKEELVLKIIKEELTEIKNKYGDNRKTEIQNIDNIDTDLIENYDCKILYTKEQYIKKLLESNDQQKLKENDEVIEEIPSQNKSTLLLITDKANRYKLPCYKLSDYHKASKQGEYIPNLIDLEDDEKIIKIVSIDEEKPEGYIVSVYKNGKVAKTDINSFLSANKKLVNCYSTESELIDINYTKKDCDVFMISSEGKGLIINTSKIKSKANRDIQGNKGIDLTELKDNEAIAAIVNPKIDLKFTLTTLKGKSKEFHLDDIAPTNKPGEERGIYKYISGRPGNEGKFLINTRPKNDKIIEAVINKRY